LLPAATVQHVFCALLAERVWPRDPVAVLEALVAAVPGRREPRELIETVRRAILPAQLRRMGLRTITPLLLDPALERALLEGWNSHGALVPNPELAIHVRGAIERYTELSRRERAFVMCATALRASLAEFVRRSGLRAAVLSYAELPAELELDPAGVVGIPAG
jgi:flagellar biosynthesis component FlhA